MSIETTDADAETDAQSRAEELAAELGSAITDLPEYERFEEAKEAVEASEEAQAEIQKFEQQRQDFMMARQMGDVTQEDLQALQQAQRDLHAIPVMEEYLDAQNRLDVQLEALNDAISAPLLVDFGEEAGGCCND